MGKWTMQKWLEDREMKTNSAKSKLWSADGDCRVPKPGRSAKRGGNFCGLKWRNTNTGKGALVGIEENCPSWGAPKQRVTNCGMKYWWDYPDQGVLVGIEQLPSQVKKH